MNKMIIIGNLTKDPELAYTQSGVARCCFTVAVNNRGGKQGEAPGVQYFRVTAWRKLAESCAQYLKKGRKVYVSGPLLADTFRANDGSTRLSLDVTADEVEFLTSKVDGEAQAASSPATATPAADPSGVTEVESDDLPF